MFVNKDITALKQALERAAEDAQHWDEVCQEVTRLFGATGTLLPASNPQIRGIWMAGDGGMKAALPSYLSEGWFQRDPREAVLDPMMAQGFATCDDIWPDRAEKAKIPIYRDYLRPLNYGNVCTIRILTPNGYWPLTVHFANDHPPLGTEYVPLIEAIQPLFEQAATRASEITHRRIYDFARFFQGSASEVFIFDADGQQCFKLDNTGQLSTQSRLETVLPPEIGESFQTELQEVLLSDPNMSLSRAYRFLQDGRDVNLLVIQIPPSMRHFFMPFKACAIRTECSDTNSLKHARLREEHGLSDAEVNTVDLLAAGKTPAMIADLMSLKPASVRQRLKLIYDKTDVNSQVELIALFARL